MDGHIGVANTRALQLASVTVASRDPDGGKIDRDDSGTPNGILREKAQGAVLAVIPKPTHEKRRQAIELALADLASHGITSAQDYSYQWDDFQIFEELENEGKLTARISEWLPFRRLDRRAESQARLAFRVRQHAPYRNAEGLHGWFARLEDGRVA